MPITIVREQSVRLYEQFDLDDDDLTPELRAGLAARSAEQISNAIDTFHGKTQLPTATVSYPLQPTTTNWGLATGPAEPTTVTVECDTPEDCFSADFGGSES